MQRRVRVGGRRVLGPAQDAEQGAGLDPDAGQPRQPCQPLQARPRDGRRGRITTRYDQCDLRIENIIETSRVSGQAGLEVLQDLAPQQRGLADQVAAMAGPELQRRVHRLPGGVQEPEAVDRGAEDPPLEVGPVGLGVVGAGLAEMARDAGVDDPRLEAGGGEGAADRPVIGAGLLDGDDEVAEVVGGDRLAQGRDGPVEAGPRVFDDGLGDEDAAVEVGEQPVGAGLGGIDGDDAEVLGADGLDARGEDAVGFAEVDDRIVSTPVCTHGWDLQEEAEGQLKTPAWESHWSKQKRRDFFLKVARYQPPRRKSMAGRELSPLAGFREGRAADPAGMGMGSGGASPSRDRAEPSSGADAAARGVRPVAGVVGRRSRARGAERALTGPARCRGGAKRSHRGATRWRGQGANRADAAVPGAARGPAPTYSDRDLEEMRARYWSRFRPRTQAG